MKRKIYCKRRGNKRSPSIKKDSSISKVVVRNEKRLFMKISMNRIRLSKAHIYEIYMCVILIEHYAPLMQYARVHAIVLRNVITVKHSIYTAQYSLNC